MSALVPRAIPNWSANASRPRLPAETSDRKLVLHGYLAYLRRSIIHYQTARQPLPLLGPRQADVRRIHDPIAIHISGQIFSAPALSRGNIEKVCGIYLPVAIRITEQAIKMPHRF